jgi:hypothetical protein
MSPRRKPTVTDEVVGGTPPTASAVPANETVVLIATCKIDGVRHLPGEVFEVTPERAMLWREKGLIADPDHPPASEFAWLSRP